MKDADSDDAFYPPYYDKAAGKEDYDSAGDFKQQAADAKADGNWEQALEFYNKAVLAAPPSALLYANRATALEKLGHYNAAEKDCNLALELNPDSAKSLKVRGKLRYKHLSDWHGALSDLNQAQTIDFDPDIAEMLKELTKLRVEEEKREAQERIEKEEKLKKRAEEIKKAQQEAKAEEARAASSAGANPFAGMGGGMPGGMSGGMPGGMAGMAEAFQNDPELKEAMKNPKVLAAFQEIMNSPGGPMSLMSNPQKMQELMADEDVGPVLQKMMGKMMGGAGGMGGMGGMPGAGGAGAGAANDDIPDLGDLPDLD